MMRVPEARGGLESVVAVVVGHSPLPPLGRAAIVFRAAFERPRIRFAEHRHPAIRSPAETERYVREQAELYEKLVARLDCRAIPANPAAPPRRSKPGFI